MLRAGPAQTDSAGRCVERRHDHQLNTHTHAEGGLDYPSGRAFASDDASAPPVIPELPYAEEHHGEGLVVDHIFALRALVVQLAGHYEGPSRVWGLGALYEREIIHHRFGIEMAAAYIFSPIEEEIPVEVLAELTLQTSPQTEVHLGAGPALAYVRRGSAQAKESDLQPGAVVAQWAAAASSALAASAA